MRRITQKDLERQVDFINKATNSPETYSTDNGDGTRTTNIGHYHLDYAYGGVKLVKTVSKGGGIRVISTGGYGTKRELYNWMDAFQGGLEVSNATS